MQKLKQELNANPVGGAAHSDPLKQKGITLIALIITIIVMLILVGVTINVALNGGLFDKADEATKQTQIEAEKEELLSAVVAAIGNDGKVDFNYLDNNLPAEWDGRNGTYTSPKRNTYTVDEDGKITKGDNGGTELDFEAIKQDVKSNPEEYLAKAKAAGQDTEAITDIGIGTDGEIVNLDLWYYSLINDLAGIYARLDSLGSNSAGYKGEFNEDGSIQGTVPQYIYSEGEIYNVTDMSYTFKGLTGLKIAPKIPSTVTSLYYTFNNCTNLTTLSEIPESVENAYDGVLSGCVNLTGTIVIKAKNRSNLTYMLYNLGSAERPIVLKGTGNNLELLEQIRANANSEYITIEQ